MDILAHTGSHGEKCTDCAVLGNVSIVSGIVVSACDENFKSISFSPLSLHVHFYMPFAF